MTRLARKLNAKRLINQFHRDIHSHKKEKQGRLARCNMLRNYAFRLFLSPHTRSANPPGDAYVIFTSQAAHTPEVVLGARHPEERRYRASTAPKRQHTSALGQRPRSPLPGCCHKAPDDRHSSAPCITCRRHRCSARSERGKRMRVGLARADPRLLSRAAATSTTIATTSYANHSQ